MHTSAFGIFTFSLGMLSFIVGLFLLRWTLQSLIGNQSKNIITAMTNSPFTGVITGIVLTTLMQSSSIVLIVILNLVSVGALPIMNAVAIVLGANLGTSLTLEFIAFSNPTWVFLLLLVWLILFACKKRLHSAVFLALAFLLIGFQLLKQNVSLLENMPFIISNTSLSENTIALLFGIIFTAMIQSSTASTTIVMTLVDSHILTLYAGVMFVYGSNIGTCVTSMIAVIGASIHSKKIMMYHVAINILCVIFLLPFVPLLIISLEYITTNPIQQIAHSQVIFNLLTIIIFYPFIKQHVALLDRLYR